MKTTSSILLALSLLSCGTASAESSVEWLSTEHNFGAFDEDMGPVSCTFRFVNTGDEPVAITAARASCGCTAPRYSREAVAPGDTAGIEVRYDPAGRPGRFHKYVAVDFSFPMSRQKLNIYGTVVGSAESLRQQYRADCGTGLRLERGAVMMGEIKKGQLKTVFIKAYNTSHDSISPLVSDIPDYMEVNVAPDRVAPGEQCSLIFYFRSADCPLYGLVTDTVSVSAGKDSPALCTLPVTAIVSEDFSKLTPKQMAKSPAVRVEDPLADFGHMTGDGPQRRTITIGNTGKSPLEIRRVYTADRGVSVEIDTKKIKPGKTAAITVTVHPEQITGAILNARISLITNDPLNPVTTLRAVGELPSRR